jgi:hypothetical protein
LEETIGGFEHYKAGGNWYVLRVVSCSVVHSSALPRSRFAFTDGAASLPSLALILVLHLNLSHAWYE